MTRDKLQLGDEVQCPHCGAWHVLQQARGLTDRSTEAVKAMLYYCCPSGKQAGLYFAGYLGGSSRLPRRRPR